MYFELKCFDLSVFLEKNNRLFFDIGIYLIKNKIRKIVGYREWFY